MNVASFKNYWREFAIPINALAKEICVRCELAGLECDEHFAAVLVILVSLNPRNNFSFKTRSGFAETVEYAVDLIAGPQTPFVGTIKIQSIFLERGQIDRLEIEDKWRAQTNAKMQPLTNVLIKKIYKDICTLDIPKCLRKLAVDVLVHCSLGDPHNKDNITEAVSALQSIMNTHDIQLFMKTGPVDRRIALEEVRNIVAGILLFNRDLENGGKNIDDVNNIIQDGVFTIEIKVGKIMTECDDRIRELDDFIIGAIKLNANEDPEILYPDMFIKHRQFTLFTRQLQVFATSLMITMTGEKARIELSKKLFENQLATVHNIIKFKTAIQSDKIFPQFIKLAKIWQEQHVQVVVLSEIKSTLDDMINVKQLIDYESVIIRLPEKKTNFRQLLQKDEHLVVDNQLCEVLDFEKKTCQFKRYTQYCIWAMLKLNGVLLPANRDIGVVKFRDSVFGLSHSRFVDVIVAHPERVKFELVDFVRSNPEYILFMDMFSDLLSAKEDVVTRYTNVAGKRDFQVQTDLHLTSSKLDRNYTWNVWDLRRKAMQLANIRRCVTTSAQTNTTFEVITTNLQTVEQASKEMQTMGVKAGQHKILPDLPVNSTIWFDEQKKYLYPHSEKQNYVFKKISRSQRK